MIDIHSHILPGWDDGSKSLEESLQMLKIAADYGTTDIVATPHANSQYRYDPEIIRPRFEELREAAGDLIRIHLGCDFHLSYENVQDALSNPDKFTINHTAYLMVELPDLVIADSARGILSRLRSVGIVPVITHPERNAVVQGRPDILRQWVADGCFIQVTGQSMLGTFGAEAEKSANSLLRDNLVHFIASDAHDCSYRPPRLDEAFRFVTSNFGSARAEALFESNPAAVLEGELLPSPALAKSKRWFEFWK